jgi:MYXO-CTERM domain-containing protein
VVENSVVHSVHTGLVSPEVRVRSPNVPVVLELRAPADEAQLAALEACGVQLERAEGRVLAYDRFVPVTVDEAALTTASTLPFVARVSLAPTHRTPPLNQSAELLRLLDARGARADLDDLVGQGITVGDVDSLVDVFHPTFFRGDGGYVAWIDVDGDKVFTPGKDAVDLDGDGKAGAGETGVALSAATVSYGKAVPARAGGWDPGYDWVYLDTNKNGARDYGPKAGFTDATPAFGEPLFVPDDVDRSGKIEVGEKFVRLQTSKFKKIRVNVDYIKTLKKVFERGKSLINVPTDLTNSQLYGFPDALHATGVLSIIAGDVPLTGRKWVGMAPGVDLVETFDVSQNGLQLPTTGATWALTEKADVMLYEMAPWTGLPLDGSDALSAVIDASTTKDHVTHTCPTGDQGSARKHARATVGAGATSDLTFTVPARTKSGAGPLTYVQMTAHVRGGSAASVSLVEPDGTVLALTNNATGDLTGTGVWYATTDTTTRGTDLTDVFLYQDLQKGNPPVGSYKLRVVAGATQITVDGYVSDDKSSWAAGAEWDEAVATDEATIGIPSTADHCIAVGAMPDHVASEAKWFEMYYEAYDVPAGFAEKPGQVRAYSPKGPRIDGVTKPDILAPDNPWAAYLHSEGVDYTGPHGSYAVFGGTSGASPHVTGVAALLAQVGLKGDAARDAIRSGALTDASMGKLPNGDYGYGRLDAATALGLKQSAETPTLAIVVSSQTAAVGEKITLTPQPDKGTDFKVKWDDDYDGTWDVKYAPLAPREITRDQPGTYAYKAHVRNGGGRVAEAITYVTFTPAQPGGGSGSGGGCGCNTPGTSTTNGALAALGALSALGLLVKRRRRQSSTGS